MTKSPEVVIIGSGLAGMSAGVRLADAGFSVTVLEKLPWIGGRTSSWDADGMEVESGYHRFLGLYNELPELLKHVGVDLDEMLCWEDEVEVRCQDGTSATIGAAPFHKPWKTLRAALGYNDFLLPSDKIALAKMFTAGVKDFKTDPSGLDRITVYEYAKHHGLSDKAIGNILVPLTEGIFFMSVTQYSAHNFFGLFAPFIPYLHKTRIGAYTGGMTTVQMQPLAAYIRKHGGSVVTGTPAARLLVEDDTVVGVEAGGKTYHADQVVLAAPLGGAKKLISDAFPPQSPYYEHFEPMLRLPSMPSVTFQIELSRPSLPIDRTTFGPGTVMTSFAEQSRTTFRGSKGRLSIILANPEKYLDADPGAVLTDVRRDAGKLGVDLTDNIIDYHLVTIPDDFYSLASGSEALRPQQATPVPGLTLAGDYTKQRHLATMEGAALSGRLAAEAIIE
jgi:15-cis-phytoene desaturase